MFPAKEKSEENKAIYDKSSLGKKDFSAYSLMKFAEKHSAIKFKLPEHPHIEKGKSTTK